MKIKGGIERRPVFFVELDECIPERGKKPVFNALPTFVKVSQPLPEKVRVGNDGMNEDFILGLEIEVEGGAS